MNKNIELYYEFANALVLMLEEHDAYSAQHSKNVSLIAKIIAEELQLSDEMVHTLTLAGLLHDIGKNHLPIEILHYAKKLNKAQFLLIEEHVQIGYRIIKDISFPWPIAKVILAHHERLDGSGYPYALQGDEILFEAKILAVADSFDAILAHRPYHEKQTIEYLKSILNDENKFDQSIVKICFDLNDKGAFDSIHS